MVLIQIVDLDEEELILDVFRTGFSSIQFSSCIMSKP